MKTCSKCGTLKHEVDFYADKREKDGLRHACKSCILSERKASYSKRRDSEIERSREWRQKNKQRHIAYNAQWREKNPAKASAQARKWQRANPAKCAAIKARRRLSGACAWASKAKIAEVYDFAQEFRDRGFDVHVDHIIPLRGKRVSGLHVEHNLRVCLASVNLRKSNQHLEMHQ